MEIIAELAQGFEGGLEQARLLLKAAASAGADAAKFQLVYADELATPDYQHHALFVGLEMADEQWQTLADDARAAGIALQLDVFGPRSLMLAERVGASAVKVHPTDLANRALLEAVAASGVARVILGAGGSHRAELTSALAMLARKDVVVLLGFQGYPTPEGANQIARLRAIAGSHPGATLGFADHASPESPLRFALAATAVGAGARVIEKHLTLGRSMKLEDHESALNPDEFAEFVAAIRLCASAMGPPAAPAEDFGMAPEETKYRTAIRRHVVAARTLPAGAVIEPRDVVLKRTSSASALTDPAAAYGRRLRREVAANSAIGGPDLEPSR